MNKKVFTNESGVSLIELFIVMALVAVVTLVTVTLVNNFEDEKKKAMGGAALAGIRNEINISLQNTKAFDATIRHPDNAAAFSCLINKQDCAGASGQIVIVGKSGKLIREISAPSQPASGLSENGQTCSGFSSSGNDNCPYQYTANWRAVCAASGKCFDPDIEINVVLNYKPAPASKLTGRINPKNYSFSYRRGQAMSSNADLCATVGGAYDPLTDHCVTPFAGECPTGEYLLGFTANSQKICGYAEYYFCPEGQILQEVKADGTLICAPGCLDPTGGDTGSMW